MPRLMFAIAVSLSMLLIDSAARLILVLHAPHLAPLPHIEETLSYGLSAGGYAIVHDHAGPLYHISNNTRATVGQPALYTHTIWVFGNSGAFGLSVSDADTMESQLQALLNRAGFQWRVVNKAVPGQRIIGEMLEMRDAPLVRGDVVIFDDGVMNLVVDRCTDNRFAVVQLICQVSYDAFDANAEDRQHFENNVNQARSITVARKATFYHFIEPTPYPMYMRSTSGVHLYVPDTLLSDAAHLTERGEYLEACQIFDALTLV